MFKKEKKASVAEHGSKGEGKDEVREEAKSHRPCWSE